MNKRMRLVISGVMFVAVTATAATPLLAQPWLQQERRYHRPAPQQRPVIQPQQRPQDRSQARPQAQQPEPVAQAPMPRGACFNKDSSPAAVISSCTALIDSGREKPQMLALIHAARG